MSYILKVSKDNKVVLPEEVVRGLKDLKEGGSVIVKVSRQGVMIKKPEKGDEKVEKKENIKLKESDWEEIISFFDKVARSCKRKKGEMSLSEFVIKDRENRR